MIVTRQVELLISVLVYKHTSDNCRLFHTGQVIKILQNTGRRVLSHSMLAGKKQSMLESTSNKGFSAGMLGRQQRRPGTDPCVHELNVRKLVLLGRTVVTVVMWL